MPASIEHIISIVASIATLVVSVSAAFAVLIKLFDKLKEPDRIQNERISTLINSVDSLKKDINKSYSDLERKIQTFEVYFKRDNDRIHLLQNDVKNIWLNMELLVDQQIAFCKDDPVTSEKLHNIKSAINEYIILKKDGNERTIYD